MFTTIKVEGGTYRAPMEIAQNVQFLQRCVTAFEATGEYNKAEKCRQRIYDYMDRALFAKVVYEIDESEAI
ncbi:MAG: hypothetical protein J6U54_04005 [Clostridiales bacterium]|nr:hypothetical protein [Clostridiales bacterium]